MARKTHEAENLVEIVKDEKIQIKSVLGSTIMHNGITIGAGESVLVDREVAKFLVDKKYCVEVKVKSM